MKNFFMMWWIVKKISKNRKEFSDRIITMTNKDFIFSIIINRYNLLIVYYLNMFFNLYDYLLIFMIYFSLFIYCWIQTKNN